MVNRACGNQIFMVTFFTNSKEFLASVKFLFKKILIAIKRIVYNYNDVM